MCDLFLTAIITVIFFTVFVQVLGLGGGRPLAGTSVLSCDSDIVKSVISM